MCWVSWPQTERSRVLEVLRVFYSQLWRLRNAVKTSNIHQTPLYLWFHVKRFTADGRKNDQIVRYSQLQDINANSYELIAVVHHVGSSPSCGHHLADIKTSSPWIDNNENVSSMTDCGQAGSAYFLPYHHRENALDGEASAVTSAGGSGGGGAGRRRLLHQGRLSG